ncbi:5-formyltetrahydrofolate cyclo-ligase family protein, partial [Chlamydia psittaci 06-1683]
LITITSVWAMVVVVMIVG